MLLPGSLTSTWTTVLLKVMAIKCHVNGVREVGNWIHRKENTVGKKLKKGERERELAVERVKRVEEKHLAFLDTYVLKRGRTLERCCLELIREESFFGIQGWVPRVFTFFYFFMCVSYGYSPCLSKFRNSYPFPILHF